MRDKSFPRRQFLKGTGALVVGFNLFPPAAKLLAEPFLPVIEPDPAKSISYAKLVGGKRFNVTMKTKGKGREMDLALGVPAKDPKRYKLVGTSAPRIDLPPKVTGEFIYSHDVTVPGMLHGRVVRPPFVSSQPLSVDEDSINDMSDVVKIVREGSFVGVVAKSEWSAVQAAKALKVVWSQPATKLPANAEELYAYLGDTKSFREENLASQGDPAAGLSQAKQDLRGNLPFSFSIAWHDRSIMRRRRRAGG